MVDKTNENTNFVIQETSKANSFETGKAGERHKIYYGTPGELKAHLDELKELSLYGEEELSIK